MNKPARNKKYWDASTESERAECLCRGQRIIKWTGEPELKLHGGTFWNGHKSNLQEVEAV
jgi:hypothetical protein